MFFPSLTSGREEHNSFELVYVYVYLFRVAEFLLDFKFGWVLIAPIKSD